MFSRGTRILFIAALALIASCKEDTGKGENKEATTGTARKGRIADRVNIVQIPLTAAELGLKGKVKDVEYTEYLPMMQGGEQIKRVMESGHNIYDEQGRLVDQSVLESGQVPRLKCVYAYTTDNKREAWHFQFFDRNDESHYRFEYGPTGNLVSETEMNGKEQQVSRKEYAYDEQGNLAETRLYDGKGKLERIETSEYDKQGNQVAAIYKNGDGTTSYRMTATYDARGYKTSGADYRGDSLDTRWVRKNNDNGQATEMIMYNKEGKIIGKTSFKYDKMGNEIEVVDEYDGKTTRSTSTYEYDAAGNVTRQVDYELQEGKPVPIREIETKYTYHGATPGAQ